MITCWQNGGCDFWVRRKSVIKYCPESGGYGLVRANGETTSRSRSAAETAKLLREYKHILANHSPIPEIGILYDPDNSMQLFAMESSDDLYTQSHIGYYRTVWLRDLYARYVTYDTLDDLDGLKVLIAPMCLTLPDHVAKAIAEFVNSGGVLIAEARMGLFDHRGFNQPTLPIGILAKVVGAVEQEAICSDPENRPPLNNPNHEQWPDPIDNGPTIVFSEPTSASFRARGFICPLTPDQGRPIAESLGYCVAVTHHYGRGHAYYFGTYLGLALAQQDTSAMSIMRTILDRHTSSKVRGNALRPRLVDAG